MKFGRTALTVLVAGCACSATAFAAPPTVQSKVSTAEFSPAPAQVMWVRNLRTGKTIYPGHTAPAPAPRGTTIGFDNLTCALCSAGLNVAYVQPGSYNGTNTATTASIFGLGNGPAGSSLRAPTNATFTIPTDIVWNDYTGDATVWPGGPDPDAFASVSEFDIVTVRINNAAGAVDRTDTYNILFFSADGTIFDGGFAVGLATPAGFAAFQRVNVDLTGLDLSIRRDGLVMVDVAAPAAGQPAIGVGLAFAGGDLVNTNYPTPQSLVTVGTCDPAFWVFADPQTGAAGPPAVVDPNFDGQAGVSYLDILNTGRLVNWGFTSTQPGGTIGTRTFAHDFPIRMSVGQPTGACVTLDPQQCFVANQADCEAQGGTFIPGGNCDGLGGACCVAGVCTDVLSPAICTALGGVFQGELTDCGSTNCPQPPANDNCSSATVISGEGTFAFDNTAATLQAGEAAACALSTKSVWFSWTPACEGNYVFSTCTGTTIDTVLSVYENQSCLPQAAAAGCDDDGCGTVGGPATTTVLVTAGNTYLVRIGVFADTAGGAGSLTVTRNEGPCAAACPCDFDASGALNSADFFAFLTAFFNNAPTADFDHSGVINSADFFAFLTCFFQPPAGCH